MEAEDPISGKFRTMVEALMIKTTSEIVKAFAEAMFETRMEISRSWREIDDLRHVLEQKEKQQTDITIKNQIAQMTFKTEEDDVVVSSHHSPAVLGSTERGGDVHISEDPATEETNTRQNISVLQQASPYCETYAPEAQVIQFEAIHKRDRPPTAHLGSAHQTSSEIRVLPDSSIQAVSAVNHRQNSSTPGTIVMSKKGPVVSKNNYMQKKKNSTQINNLKYMLRDRHLLSSQKTCLCCISSQCPEQPSESKRKSLVASCVYTCTKCATEFKDKKVFKSHKCSSKPKCSRCGQTFTSLKTLAKHNELVPTTFKKPFIYKCYLCDHMFATECGWNIHMRIHAHGHVSEIGQQALPSPSHSFSAPKDLKAKVEVRLQRISEAQLEAALFPNDSMLLDDQNIVSSVGLSKSMSSVEEPTPFPRSSNKPSAIATSSTPMINKESVSNIYTELAIDCHGSSSGTDSSASLRQLEDGTTDLISPAASSRKQPAEKWIQSKSLMSHRVDSVECDESSSSASEDLTKGLSSPSRKRKMSDCNHDVYNGVFPVEKIIRWRKTKGRSEVRIKWMPCSLCGAKWKNTWEPAESFISYKDGRNEQGGNTAKWN